MISEMIHTASLLHDDVLDEATTRRGKKSVNMVFTDKQTILAGDYILSKASIALARLGNCKAVELIAEIIEDLVKGTYEKGLDQTLFLTSTSFPDGTNNDAYNSHIQILMFSSL